MTLGQAEIARRENEKSWREASALAKANDAKLIRDSVKGFWVRFDGGICRYIVTLGDLPALLNYLSNQH